jgi:hypothetical protein
VEAYHGLGPCPPAGGEARPNNRRLDAIKKSPPLQVVEKPREACLIEHTTHGNRTKRKVWGRGPAARGPHRTRSDQWGMPVKWKPLQLISTAPTTAQPPPAPVTVTPIATTARAKPRMRTACPRETPAGAAPPLRDDVMLTPGGHRKHTLTRTSPGGTTRTTQYTSPRKGDVCIDNSTEVLESEEDLELEQYFRRCDALNAVPCQQSAAQRSALARAKRKAGVPAAPQAKRGDRKPWGFRTGHFEQRLAPEYVPPPSWASMWRRCGGIDNTGGDAPGSMWDAYQRRDERLREEGWYGVPYSDPDVSGDPRD